MENVLILTHLNVQLDFSNRYLIYHQTNVYLVLNQKNVHLVLILIPLQMNVQNAKTNFVNYVRLLTIATIAQHQNVLLMDNVLIHVQPVHINIGVLDNIVLIVFHVEIVLKILIVMIHQIHVTQNALIIFTTINALTYVLLLWMDLHNIGLQFLDQTQLNICVFLAINAQQIIIVI